MVGEYAVICVPYSLLPEEGGERTLGNQQPLRLFMRPACEVRYNGGYLTYSTFPYLTWLGPDDRSMHVSEIDLPSPKLQCT